MARGGPGWRPHRRRPEELAPSCATVPHAQIEPRGQRAGRAEEPHGAAARAPAQTQASRGGCLLSREGGKRSGTEEGGPGGEGRLGRGRDARGRPSGQAPQPAAAVGQRYRATKKGARPTLCINLQSAPARPGTVPRSIGLSRTARWACDAHDAPCGRKRGRSLEDHLEETQTSEYVCALCGCLRLVHKLNGVIVAEAERETVVHHREG